MGGLDVPRWGQALDGARMGEPCPPRCYPGRRRGRALVRRAAAAGPGRVAGAAGYGLVAWGLNTEAATPAEVQETSQRLLRNLAGERGVQAPATARPETPAVRRIERFFHWVGLVSPVASVAISVPWRIRHPRRLTAPAIVSEAPAVAYGVLRGARAVQRRRPRMAVGSALVAAGSLARLRAASTEPLQ